MPANAEQCSKKELIVIIGQQSEKINRLETRLRDVVIAYKGLAKEKEALEVSVKALSAHANQENVNEDATDVSSGEDSAQDKEDKGSSDDLSNETVQLKQQLTTLTNSLATLSAEKSRMEASFQADKKQLRSEKEEREKIIREFQEKNLHAVSEIENLKSKLTTERHERDKEQNDHGVMIRELQKLLSDERHQLELVEGQNRELKRRLAQIEQQSGLNDKKLHDTRNELEATRRKLKRTEAELKNKEAPPLQLELQEEMASLKLQHQAAILQEQKRVAEAEEAAHRLAAMHEERVASLEAHLAELSETVGSYDRLRQHDQAAIAKLKERITQLDMEHSANSSTSGRTLSSGSEEAKEKSETDSSWDVQSLVEKIPILKAQLILASQQTEKPIDTRAILGVQDAVHQNDNLHNSCQEEISSLRIELEWLKKQKQRNNEEEEDTASLVNALKERIQLLNAQMNAKEENKQIIENLQKMLKAEKARSKSELTALETDYRCRVSLLEQQLQKQRERSLLLLEDKEQEIRMLKTSFGMFLPGNSARLHSPNQQETSAQSSDTVKNFSYNMSKNSGTGDSPHMLHYAHEIARRDVEITNLRRANNHLESSLRDVTRKLTSEKEVHQEELSELQESVARLERCKSREGANLEYLKNVVLSFLTSNDDNCKSHMLNAISAVLKFSSGELQRVSKIHKSPVQMATR